MSIENNPELVRFGQPLPIEVETFLRFSNPWWEGQRLLSPASQTSKVLETFEVFGCLFG